MDSTNRVIKRIGVALDVTDRAESARALQESEERYRDLVENSHDLICTHDLEGRVLSMNELPARILGYRPEDLVGHRIPEMLSPEVHDQFGDYIQRIQREGSAKGLMVLKTHSGERRIWKYHNTLRIKGVPAPIVRGMAHDITEQKEAEKELRKSEALLAQAEEIGKFGSWEFDLKTRKSILSKHLLQMYDLTSDTEWTEDMYWERLNPEDRQRGREIREHALAECKPYEYVARYHAPDGQVRVHFVRGVPILGPDGKPERTIGFVQDITDQTRAEEDLRRLSQELIRASDEGRRHAARELHESAGQSLAALKMTLGRLRDSLPENGDLLQELLQSSIELAESAVREVRTISYLMHPPLLDEAGLGPALRWYAKGFAQRSGIAVNVEVPEDFGRASQEIETTVFRIVQEALTNVHRYSGSRTASIRLAREHGQIRVEVRDEGCGLALPSPAQCRQAPPGVGIAGMRERVKQVNGVFELESVPGMGTTVRVILPVAPAELPRRLTDPDKASQPDAKLKGKARRASG